MTTRFALAGAGSFGREHLTRLTARPDVTVVGVADPSGEARARAAALAPDVPLFSDPFAMLASARPDALVVASHSATHADIAVAALSRGIATLIEKPVALSVAEARRIADAARPGTLAAPGHILRHSGGHRRLAALVRSGAIGEVVSLKSRRHRDAAHADLYADTDPVLLTMIHDIDLALWLAACRCVDVTAWRSTGAGHRTLTEATLRFDNGVRADLSAAWTFASGNEPPDRVEVIGRTGALELSANTALAVFAAGEPPPPFPASDAIVAEHDAFLAAMAGKAPYPPPFPVAIEGLAIAEAVLAAIASGQREAVRP